MILTAARKLFPRNSTWQTPAEWLRDAIGGTETASGERVNESSAMGLSAYFAAIRAISEDVGKLPLIVYRRKEPRGKDRDTNHPVYRLLHDQPNEDMTAMSLRETLTAHALAYHGGYAEIVRNGGGVPVALYPLAPSQVSVKRTEDRQLYYEVRTSNGQAVVLPADSVLHLHGLGYDGITGYVMAQIARESLGRAMAAQRHSSAFFGNGATMSGFVEFPGPLGPKEEAELRAMFDARYTGNAGKAYKVGYLKSGGKWHPTTTDPDKSQLIETLQFGVEDVARWFRIPPHKIQHLLRSTNNNIEHQGIEYVQDTLQPWLVRWEQEIKRKLFSKREADYFAEHAVNGLMRGDSAARSTFYREQFNIGALSQNDIRDFENLNPIDNGDTYYINASMVPSEIAAMGPQKPDPVAPAAPATSDPSPNEQSPPPSNASDPAVKAVAQAHEDAFAHAIGRILTLESDRVKAAAKKSDHVKATADVLAAMSEIFRRELSAQFDAAVESLAAVMGRTHPNRDEWALKAMADAATLHQDASRFDADALDKVAAWSNGARARNEAKAIVDGLVDSMKTWERMR